MTSTTNAKMYQKKFDELFGLATADNWDRVRDYKVTGSNSYSKLVARYREDLLAVYAAQHSATAKLATANATVEEVSE